MAEYGQEINNAEISATPRLEVLRHLNEPRCRPPVVKQLHVPLHLPQDSGTSKRFILSLN